MAICFSRFIVFFLYCFWQRCEWEDLISSAFTTWGKKPLHNICVSTDRITACWVHPGMQRCAPRRIHKRRLFIQATICPYIIPGRTFHTSGVSKWHMWEVEKMRQDLVVTYLLVVKKAAPQMLSLTWWSKSKRKCWVLFEKLVHKSYNMSEYNASKDIFTKYASPAKSATGIKQALFLER